MYSYEEREQRRKQLLEECLELFVIQGLENTSLNDLSKYCKTYKAAFYNYFKSKDEIVFECTKMYMEKLHSVLSDEIAHSKKSLSEALSHGFEILTAEKQNLRYVYQVFSSPKYGERSRKELTEIYNRYLNYSSLLADAYSIDGEKFRPYFLLYVATIHDFCLWENSEAIAEKLQYILDCVKTL